MLISLYVPPDLSVRVSTWLHYIFTGCLTKLVALVCAKRQAGPEFKLSGHVTPTPSSTEFVGVSLRRCAVEGRQAIWAHTSTNN